MLRASFPIVLVVPLLALPLAGCLVVEKTIYTSDEYAAQSSPSRQRIGVSLARVSETTASQLRLDADRATVISEVNDNSPAQRAGLRKYDIVTGVDGSTWASPAFLREAVQAKQSGETIRLSVIREGQPTEVVVTVASVGSSGPYD